MSGVDGWVVCRVLMAGWCVRYRWLGDVSGVDGWEVCQVLMAG